MIWVKVFTIPVLIITRLIIKEIILLELVIFGSLVIDTNRYVFTHSLMIVGKIELGVGIQHACVL